MRTRELVLACAKGAFAVALSVCVAGCGGAQQASAPTTDEAVTTQDAGGDKAKQGQEERDGTQDVKQTPASKVADARQVLGTESADATEVALTNGLGAQLTAVKVRKTGADAYGANLVAKDKAIANEEEVRLFVDAKKDGTDATYDLLVTKKTADGKSADVTFVEVPVSIIVSAKLVENDGIAYVEYTTTDGKVDSTRKAADAAKRQAEQQQKSTNATAGDDASSQGDAEDTSYYGDGSADYDDGGAFYDEPAEAPQEAPEAPAQTGDACTGDVEFR